MYWQYVKAVLRRAVRPAKGTVELVQFIVALAVPALAKFAGANVPTNDNILAYIGLAAVLFVALRVLFVAPFQLWREQVGEIETLKLELSEPERREIAHMAVIRAEKRLELAAVLREFHWAAFIELADESRELMHKIYARALALMGQAGVPPAFTTAFSDFTDASSKMNRARRDGAAKPSLGIESLARMNDMIEFLHGRLTAEQLALRLKDYPEQPELPLEKPSPAEPPNGDAS